jgi:hypothetical protein
MVFHEAAYVGCHTSLQGRWRCGRSRRSVSATDLEQLSYDDETEFYRLEDNTGIVQGIWILLHHTMGRN